MSNSRSIPGNSENSISIVHNSSEITDELRQASSQLIHKAQTSDNPLESGQWMELAHNTLNKALDIQKSAPEKSEDKKLLDKILSTNDPSVREQLLNLYPTVIDKQEQVRQNGFTRKMIVAFLCTGIVIGTAGVVLEIPIILGAGGFLLGGSMFSIVPDYVSKVIDKSNISGVFPATSSNGDDNQNRE